MYPRTRSAAPRVGLRAGCMQSAQTWNLPSIQPCRGAAPCSSRCSSPRRRRCSHRPSRCARQCVPSASGLTVPRANLSRRSSSPRSGHGTSMMMMMRRCSIPRPRQRARRAAGLPPPLGIHGLPLMMRRAGPNPRPTSRSMPHPCLLKMQRWVGLAVVVLAPARRRRRRRRARRQIASRPRPSGPPIGWCGSMRSTSRRGSISWQKGRRRRGGGHGGRS